MIARHARVARLWFVLAFRGAPRLGALRIVVSVLAAVARPLAALGAGLLIDGLRTADPGRTSLGLWLIGAQLVVAVVDGLVHAMVAATLEDLNERDVRSRVMRLIGGIPGIAHHQDPDMADRVSLVREKARRLGSGIWSIPFLFSTVASTVVICGVLSRVSWLLVLLVPAALAPAWLVGRSARLRGQTENDHEWGKRLADRMLEIGRSPDHGLEIRCSAAGPAILDSLHEALTRRREVIDAVARRTQWMAVGARVGFLALTAVALLAVFAMVRSGGATVGSLVVVVLLLPQVVAMADNFQQVVALVVRSWKQLVPYLDLEDYARAHSWSDGSDHAPDRLRTGIEIDDVTFSYPGSSAPALRRVSLHLAPGTTLALVGENGAGKTTLVALLARLWDPASGEIRVDGTPLCDLDVVAWRSRLSAAFQDHADLELEVRDSVGVGDLGAGDDRIRQALERSTGTRVVDQLPAGLDTQLGRQFEGGTDLSGGQWQRLAIARGLLREDPLLMLLDEPTSALDPEAEEAILEGYVARARDVSRRTGGITLIVSHRMSTVRAADRIAFLHDGAVVEEGSHDELVALGGRYAELFDLQARGYR